MEYRRGGYGVVALCLIALFCSTTPLDAQAPPREQPRFGGVLKIATIGEPPSLDPHSAGVGLTRNMMWHVFETLYTLDKDWSPIPISRRVPCQRGGPRQGRSPRPAGRRPP